MDDITRRRFVIQGSKLIAFLPFMTAAGCLPDKKINLSSEDSLKRLIYIIGPWTIDDNLIAKDFAKRFLKTNFAKQYLSKSVSLIESLSRQFDKETIAVKEIHLIEIPETQKKMLLNLSKQLYSFVEIRFYASNEPTWGECQGNSIWHTRIPK